MWSSTSEDNLLACHSPTPLTGNVQRLLRGPALQRQTPPAAHLPIPARRPQRLRTLRAPLSGTVRCHKMCHTARSAWHGPALLVPLERMQML